MKNLEKIEAALEAVLDGNASNGDHVYIGTIRDKFGFLVWAILCFSPRESGVSVSGSFRWKGKYQAVVSLMVAGQEWLIRTIDDLEPEFMGEIEWMPEEYDLVISLDDGGSYVLPSSKSKKALPYSQPDKGPDHMVMIHPDQAMITRVND